MAGWDQAQVSLAAAQSLLAARRGELGVLEEAVKRPKCWFDRNWSDGPGVLLPEYADMKEAAKLLAIRGSVAANRGDWASALADVGRVFVIARHAGTEPHVISRLVRDGAYSIGIKIG